MKKLVDSTVRLIRAGTQIYAKKWSFFGVFVFVFFCLVMILGTFDLLPETPPIPVSSGTAIALATGVSTKIVTGELPVKIRIPTINLMAIIANPTTTDTEVLDRELLSGAVRYPTSAKLGETGNVVLFGHSSYLPIVGNQAYKTFNGIQKLVIGDVITVYSSNMTYTYQVRNVTKESANDAFVSLQISGRALTLATCDSFGAKTDRFVVIADFVESHAISS